jgi:hypothetical protein
MSREKEHAFSSDLMYQVVKENGQYQTERDEALKKVAELEKKLAGQQGEQQQQQEPTDQDLAIAQAKAMGWSPKTIAFN